MSVGTESRQSGVATNEKPISVELAISKIILSTRLYNTAAAAATKKSITAKPAVETTVGKTISVATGALMKHASVRPSCVKKFQVQ